MALPGIVAQEDIADALVEKIITELSAFSQVLSVSRPERMILIPTIVITEDVFCHGAGHFSVSVEIKMKKGK